MTTSEENAAVKALERAGYVVLTEAEAKAIGRVLPMLTDDEVNFALGRRSAAFRSALRKFGLA